MSRVGPPLLEAPVQVYVVGNTIIRYWTVLDAAFAPLTGMVVPTHVTLKLHRQSGATMIVAAEQAAMAASWAEIAGDPGHYYFAFVPLSTGLYVAELQELEPTSLLRQQPFEFSVTSAGAQFAASYANAFCAESDIERWCQFSIDGGTKPTSSEAAAFAEARASEIIGILAAEGWIVAPGDAALVGTPGEDMLRECNAILAAADCYLAKFMDTEPAKTEKAGALLEEGQRRLERLIAYADKVSGKASIGSPMVDGEVTLRDETRIEDSGLRDAITMDMDWP